MAAGDTKKGWTARLSAASYSLNSQLHLLCAHSRHYHSRVQHLKKLFSLAGRSKKPRSLSRSLGGIQKISSPPVRPPARALPFSPSLFLRKKCGWRSEAARPPDRLTRAAVGEKRTVCFFLAFVLYSEPLIWTPARFRCHSNVATLLNRCSPFGRDGEGESLARK